jgi:nitroreductase
MSTTPASCIETPDVDVLRRLLSDRHSTRGYVSRQVPREVIVTILEMAQRTASWSNIQPWQVVITTGSGTERFRAALYQEATRGTALSPDLAFPDRYEGVYLERRVRTARLYYESVGAVDRLARVRQKSENYRFFGAPHVAIITTERALGSYGVLDCGGYVANFMLAAQSVGIASLAQASIASYASFIRSYFGIPDNRLVVCGIAFGYEDESHPANRVRCDRLAADDVVTWIDA